MSSEHCPSLCFRLRFDGQPCRKQACSTICLCLSLPLILCVCARVCVSVCVCVRACVCFLSGSVCLQAFTNESLAQHLYYSEWEWHTKAGEAQREGQTWRYRTQQKHFTWLHLLQNKESLLSERCCLMCLWSRCTSLLGECTYPMKRWFQTNTCRRDHANEVQWFWKPHMLLTLCIRTH